jgi:predicted flavoprotein YhiN
MVRLEPGLLLSRQRPHLSYKHKLQILKSGNEIWYNASAMAKTTNIADLAIVGGGAAGMFASAAAAERGIRGVLIERKARLGSKVLMTANGRCNFTKDISADDFISDLRLPGNPHTTASFVERAIRECPPRKIIAGLKSLNIPLRRMADARMFPANGQASTIVHAFGDILRESCFPIITNCAVSSITPVDGGFELETGNFTLHAKNVLLATGGASYPKTGSVGDGQKFARNLGHRIVPLSSGLIGMETSDRRITSRAGARFEDARAKVISPDGRALYEHRGEVDCESFGLSGAAVYNCQRFIAHSKLKDFELEVWLGRERLRFANLRSRPLKEAIVTLGGIATDEINPNTMESKIVPRLYFAGEVMDIDGPTGGYNLTLAFATARKAIAAISQQNGKTDYKHR